MKKIFITVVASAMIGSAATYFCVDQYTKLKQREAASQIRSYAEELLGHVKTTTVIVNGEPKVIPRSRLLTASVDRDYDIIQTLNGTVVLIAVNATIGVHYTAEFSFGYDLKPENFEIRSTAKGIEVKVGNPILISTPAVKKMSHQILNGSIFMNSAAFIALLQQKLPEYAIRAGNDMIKEEAIKALCEKNLLAFLKSFSSKYPGMTQTPEITIVYK